MNLHELQFQIRYSFHLETMQAVLCGRIDRLLCIGQIFLGSMCAAFTAIAPVMGVLIALLAAVAMVCQFAAKGVRAEHQAAQLKPLLTSNLSASELEQQFTAIQENDSEVFGALRNAAHMRATIAMGLTDDGYQLTRFEKVMAWLAGDLPPHP